MNKSNQALKLTVKNYPSQILVPTTENILNFQAINCIKESKKFFFEFQGQNINIEIPMEYQSVVNFNSGEIKDFNIKLVPIIDGQGKLVVNVSLIKEVKKKLKVQTIRSSVPKNKLKEHFRKYKILLKDIQDDFNINDFLLTINENDLRLKEGQAINKVPGLEKDQDLKFLARGYLSNRNIQKALEYALQISNEDEKYHYYYDLIRAHASLDLRAAFQIINNLKDEEKKNFLIQSIAFEISKYAQDKIEEKVLLIDNPIQKQEFLVMIIGRLIKTNPPMAFELSHLIRNELLIAKIFINLAKRFRHLNNIPESVRTLNQILNIFQNSPKINLNNTIPQVQVYDFIKDILQLIAEIDCPNSAYTIINGFKNEMLKIKILEDLGNILLEVKEEMKVVQESHFISSQYFLFNTLVSQLSEELTEFSLIGGNVSYNLLMRDYSFSAVFFSLSRFPFSIFPTLEHLYSDMGNQIAFYVFPSTGNHRNNELKIINNNIKRFVNPVNVIPQTKLYNLDFIPYLGKPTAILSEGNDIIKKKIEKQVGSSAIVIRDNSFFNGGTSSDNLNKIFSGRATSVVNIVLSYEFINDYGLLKSLMQALI
ncbi:MAG: hypothetical protein ACFFAS_05735 [Promethearchaeota archaeon]